MRNASLKSTAKTILSGYILISETSSACSSAPSSQGLHLLCLGPASAKVEVREDNPDYVKAMSFVAPFTMPIDDLVGLGNDYVSKFPTGTITFATPQGTIARRRSPRAIGTHTGGAAAADADGAIATTTNDNEDLSDEAASAADKATRKPINKGKIPSPLCTCRGGVTRHDT